MKRNNRYSVNIILVKYHNILATKYQIAII